MNEDKQLTCNALAEALRTTENGFETVTPVFEAGRGTPINVTYDSCWAVIKDVVRGLRG